MKFSSVLFVLVPSLLFVSTTEAVTTRRFSAEVEIQERLLKSGKKAVGKKAKKSSKRRGSSSKDESRSPVVAQVFTLTNDAEELRGNEVVMYNQMNDGSLQIAGRFPTGGIGFGPGVFGPEDPLGAQGSLIVAGDHLFAVNAGNMSVSAFQIMPAGLVRTDIVSSKDDLPVSLAYCDGLLYVLNLGSTNLGSTDVESGFGSINGYQVASDGKLIEIEDSFRVLTAVAQPFFPPFILSSPGQVGFTPDCSQLVITLKDGIELDAQLPFSTGPGRVVVFGVTEDGTTENPVETILGVTPFSFNIVGEKKGSSYLFITETLQNALSSHRINDDNTITPISGSVTNGAGASSGICWNVNDGNYMWVANEIISTISTYRIEDDFGLTLLETLAATVENGAALDMAYANGYVYQLWPRLGLMTVYEVNEDDGSLTEVGRGAGLNPAPTVAAILPFQPGSGPLGAAVYVN